VTFKEGDKVIIQILKKRFLTTLKKDALLHTNKGYIRHEEIIGKKPGAVLKTSRGVPAWVFSPTLRDYIMKVQRQTNIIYPKDIAFIITYTGIKNGYRVGEAGSGSGALTTALAYFVSPKGRVYSYEKRGGLQKVARENVEKAGLSEFVEFKIGDVTEKIEENELDVFILDIPTPWEALESVRNSLKNGGFLVSYLPTIGQVEKAVLAMRECGFASIEPMEVLFRTWKVEKEATRPDFEMVGHTGFLIFSRKVSGEVGK
jgi:tRNA (adenine57-N1/adenine58-N1)-methyltransferase